MAVLAEQIDAILPQTQCRECTFAGCKPYAEALVRGERIDRCTPGGVSTLQNIAKFLHKNADAYIDSMQAKQSIPKIVTIVEDDCIGCTKCIKACPVDAIIGTGKKMHTIIKNECTGCDLCIPACPVDCIVPTKQIPNYNKGVAKNRFELKSNRLNVKDDSIYEINNDDAKTITKKQNYINNLLKKND